MKEGWQITQLGDVAKFINGRAYKQNELLDRGPYPVLRVGNFFTNRNWYYSDFELEADKYCDTGDLLYAWSASFGPRIWDGGKVIYHYHIWKIEPDPTRIDKGYLFHFLEWDKEKIQEQQGAGTTMVHVTKGSIEKRLVELPPLPEQQRIVAILDEAFAGLATATANAEKNLKNARELFEGYLNSAFQSDHDWKDTTLGAIADFKNGVNFTRSSKGEKIRIVGVKDFQNNFWLPTEGLDSVQIEGGLSESYELRKHDILIVRSNGNKQLIGRCILASDVPQKTSHSGFTIRVRLMRSDVNPEYLVRYLKSCEARRALIDSGDGAQISNLNQQALTVLPVRLLDPKQQQARVGQFREIEADAERLARVYERKINDLSELKQSILQKAFSGELTSPPRPHPNPLPQAGEGVQEAAE